jgi:hypothetical protein
MTEFLENNKVTVAPDRDIILWWKNVYKRIILIGD